jgi:hypothetical protein
MPISKINLTSGVTGTMPVANGGTGLTSGTADQFLKFTGTTTLASAADNAGKLGQIVTQAQTASQSITSSSFTATTTGTSITPAATSSKILVQVNMQVQLYSSSATLARGNLRIYRDIGGAGYSAVYPLTDVLNVGGTYNNSAIEISTYQRVPLIFLDSPNTTSAVNYKVYGRQNNASSMTISNSNGDSTMILTEILA